MTTDHPTAGELEALGWKMLPGRDQYILGDGWWVCNVTVVDDGTWNGRVLRRGEALHSSIYGSRDEAMEDTERAAKRLERLWRFVDAAEEEGP